MVTTTRKEAQIFKALGDPVRLTIVQRLAGGREPDYTVGTLSRNLGLTRQGARRQIQVLVDAHLLTLRPLGREIHVQLNNESLEIARSFIEKMEAKWERRLAALKDSLEGPEEN